MSDSASRPVSPDCRGRDLHYPLLADPEVYRDGSGGNWEGWRWGQVLYGSPSGFGAAVNNPAYFLGLYQSMPTNSIFNSGAYAHFWYRAPAGTFIHRAELGGMAFQPVACAGGSCMRWWMGLMNSAYSAWEQPVNYLNGWTPPGSGPNPPIGTSTDGLHQQTRTYDSVTGRLISLFDDGVGTLSATYDSDGNVVTETLPNGLRATITYDESGAATRRVYEKVVDCQANCQWLTFEATSNIHGQWVAHAGSLSSQAYRYDAVGRLVEVRDTVNGRCSTRAYTYDANSNRKTQTTLEPSADGSCGGPLSQTKSLEHDPADRVSSAGFVYDSFGRTLVVPSAFANGGDLVTSFFANDLVFSQRQDGVVNSYELDPLLRVRERVSGPDTGSARVAGDVLSGREVFHYADDSDSPAWTSDVRLGGWTRNVIGLDGALAASQTSGGEVVFKLSNLHGDVIADASSDSRAVAPLASYEADEFGVPRQPLSARYSWLGTHRRSTELRSGTIAMGVRSYIPSLGRFLQTDPVAGGSCNAYDYVCQDPVNKFDLEGDVCLPCIAAIAARAVLAAKRARDAARAKRVAANRSIVRAIDTRPRLAPLRERGSLNTGKLRIGISKQPRGPRTLSLRYKNRHLDLHPGKK